MLAAEMEEVVEVFLEEVPVDPEMPESAESFLEKCLPAKVEGMCILLSAEGISIYGVS
jgi:hypothetical protein